MTTDKLFDTWTDEELRAQIKNYARRMTRSEKRYKQLVCKAWETLGDSLPGKTNEYYFGVARHSMHRLKDIYNYETMPPERDRWMQPKQDYKPTENRIAYDSNG